MGRSITFTVPAVPVAQPRPRAFARGGRASVYGAPKEHPVHTFKAMVRLTAMQEYAGPLLLGPLRVDLTFVLPRPKALTWKKRPMPRHWHVSKPDTDNLQKTILDSISGQLFADDAQVADIRVKKYVAAGGESPSVTVTVTELGDDTPAN